MVSINSCKEVYIGSMRKGTDEACCVQPKLSNKNAQRCAACATRERTKMQHLICSCIILRYDLGCIDIGAVELAYLLLRPQYSFERSREHWLRREYQADPMGKKLQLSGVSESITSSLNAR